jgi:hypothetical protein
MTGMLEQSVKFQYQAGIVTGGYSFSAYNNIITLSGYVETLDNARVREAIHYEAEKARTYYVETVNKLKLCGEKVSTFYVKRDAIQRARKEAQSKYMDVWNEVESVCKANETAVITPQPTVTDIVNQCNARKPIISLVRLDSINARNRLDDIIKQIHDLYPEYDEHVHIMILR